MSLADEVLAEHTKASLGDYCSVCHDAWPCEPLRLARSLKAAEKVVEAARDEHGRNGGSCLCHWPGPTKCSLAAALAEYDKEGQG